MEFTAPYMEVDNTYLVPVNSPIHTLADADRSGVRIGAGLESTTGLFLLRTIKHAQLVNGNATELLSTGKADIYAASRNLLLTVQERLSGYRLLDEGFDPVRHALALPRGRDLGLAYNKSVRGGDQSVWSGGGDDCTAFHEGYQRCASRSALKSIRVALIASITSKPLTTHSPRQ
jgi:ABC-type amino acid transport substrate-binding protein